MGSRSRILGCLVTCVLAGSMRLDAQVDSGLRVGARVRVTTVELPATRHDGAVVSLTSDSLTIRGDDARSFAYRRADISQLEVSAERYRSPWKGLGFGALIGAGTGAAIGFASGDDKCTSTADFGCYLTLTAPVKAAVEGVVLGVVGGVVGLIIGSVNRSDRWVVASQNTGFVPIIDRNGRFGISASF